MGLPQELQDDIVALIREAYEGKNLSTIKDAWLKRHPGQSLDTAKWGFKNFSTAMATIEDVTLELHLEKTLTKLAFFEGSPAHLAYQEDKRRWEAQRAAKEAKSSAEEKLREGRRVRMRGKQTPRGYYNKL